MEIRGAQGPGQPREMLVEPVSAVDLWTARLAYRRTKRGFDVVVSLIGLLVCTPLLTLIAVAIMLDSPGPVVFSQDRVGQGGRVFRILKFRTMRTGSLVRISGQPHKLPGDERVTRVGRWLRRSSLDELPQLVNVLRGEMSLVGPRPEIVEIVRERYEPWQFRRFSVPQGITGWWQISNRHQPIYKSAQADLYYLEHASFWFDLKILLLTAWSVVRMRGAF